MVYSVIETPHEQPAAAAKIHNFETRHEALISCARTMKAHLTELSKLNEPEQGISALQLFNQWQTTGRGYRIEPEDPSQPAFSDVDFARLYVLRLTNDYSHPLFFEVTTTDYLRTASGVASPQKNWKFWVKAPATYLDGDVSALMFAGIELLYEEMSRQSGEADGSSLMLLDTKYKIVPEAEARAAMDAHKSATIYAVHDDGSLRRTSI